MRIFAMSDIHGCLDSFLDALNLVPLEESDVKLILLGDYIHGGYDSYAVIEKIIELKKKYKSKVVVLMGNYENWVIEQRMSIIDEYRDDGDSHYYIDGDVLKNAVVPVIVYDTNSKKFYEVHDYGIKEIKHTYL